ncbi:hypothetical protein GY45DRAFT_1000910 [Cubamyces sp. BRFM 1775]|nr:hypothetical protein GY45DRAFT_1000910 [Cubamyces sp. BRFM 1775]
MSDDENRDPARVVAKKDKGKGRALPEPSIGVYGVVPGPSLSDDQESASAGIVPKRTILCDDVIVDNILSRLDIEDIAKLRQVSQQFWQCSTEAAVWKRRLEREKHYLPPVPPTARYSLENISAVESERLLTRISSLTKVWNRHEPPSLHNWQFDAHHVEVTEMALLPGGQYIVAAVNDLSQDTFSIRVFTADFQYSMAQPIATMEVPTKAIELKAKYMMFRGDPGIMIVHIRRDYRHNCFRTRFDVNSLPVDYQPPANDRRLKYECVVAHVPLAAVELLGELSYHKEKREWKILAEQQGRPFHVLAEIKSRSRLSQPAIDDDVNGAPFVAVLKHVEAVADRIVYKNLDGGPGSTLVMSPNPLLPPEFPNSIMAFCILPNQKQFMVFLRMGDNPADDAPNEDAMLPIYWAEFWDIIDGAGKEPIVCNPAARSNIHLSEGHYWKKVWLTDHGLGPALEHDRSLRPQLLGPGGRPKLKPITLYAQANNCGGIPFYTLFPAGHPLAHNPMEVPPPGPDAYRYVFTEEFMQFDWSTVNEEAGSSPVVEMEMLPGSARSILYSFFASDRHADGTFDIWRINAVWDKGLLDPHNMELAQALAELAGYLQPTEDNELITDEGEPVFDVRHLEMGPARMEGISAIAWDDTIGRLCIAYAKDPRIAVYDFAAAPLRCAPMPPDSAGTAVASTSTRGDAEPSGQVVGSW